MRTRPDADSGVPDEHRSGRATRGQTQEPETSGDTVPLPVGDGSATQGPPTSPLPATPLEEVVPDGDPGPALDLSGLAPVEAARTWWTTAAGPVARLAVSLVVLSLVLVAGVLVADRWALAHARSVAEDAVAGWPDEVTGLEIEIDGFPFLPQVVEGRLDQVAFAADSVLSDGVELTDVEGVATGVSTSAPVTVEDLVASAVVPLSTIQLAVDQNPVEVRFLGEIELDAVIDRGRLMLGTDLLPGTLYLSADVAPDASGRGLDITIVDANYAGLVVDLDSIPLVGDRLPLEHHVPLDGLPEGMVVTDTDIVTDGIAVAVEGTDLLLETAG